jgi:flagellar biosynthesis component FlhA
MTVRAAVLCLALGDRRVGQQRFEEWRQLSSDIDRWDPYGAVAGLKSIVAQPHLAAVLRGYLDSQLRQAMPEAKARELVDGARALWQDELWDELPEEPGGKATTSVGMLNVMTPIALELESGVLERLGGTSNLEKAYERHVQKRLEEHYGVRIPRLRSRSLEYGAPGDYRILIHEARREQGVLRMDSVAVVETAPALHSLAGEPVANGLGQTWHWISAKLAAAGRSAGLEVLPPLDLLMHHIEQTLAANLVELVAHQEVQNLLDKHGLIKPGESQKIVTLEAERHIGPLTKVLRALVAERVPLVDFRTIYMHYTERRAAGAPNADIVEDVRQMDGIRDALWGNDSAHTLWRLGASFEPILERHLAARPRSAVLMTRQERESLLAPILEQLGGRPRVALVVAKQRHRALARALVAKVLPNLPVLSRRELRTGLESGLAGTIELRAAAPFSGAAKSA